MNRKTRYGTSFDAKTVGRKDARGQIANQRCHAYRRKRSDRVAAYNQLEAIEGATERRAESTGDRRGGTAADQNTHIAPAQAERTPDHRSDAARDLCVSRLEANRGADTARPDGLGSYDQAAPHGHASPAQRVRLDRVDFRAAPTRDEGSDQTE